MDSDIPDSNFGFTSFNATRSTLIIPSFKTAKELINDHICKSINELALTSDEKNNLEISLFSEYFSYFYFWITGYMVQKGFKIRSAFFPRKVIAFENEVRVTFDPTSYKFDQQTKQPVPIDQKESLHSLAFDNKTGHFYVVKWDRVNTLAFRRTL